ncbi:MAG: adenylate cyclase Cya3, partial [Gemmatimonadetes bacterium]|nr:adenylate cyclase Cya3 [Gemmatimonadota bacterium]
QHSAELAACCAATGNDHEAAKQKAETIRLNPEFSTEKYVASLPYKNAGDREHLRDALRRAGLPE